MSRAGLASIIASLVLVACSDVVTVAPTSSGGAAGSPGVGAGGVAGDGSGAKGGGSDSGGSGLGGEGSGAGGARGGAGGAGGEPPIYAPGETIAAVAGDTIFDVFDLAVDPQGNVIIAGTFGFGEEDLALGNCALSHNGSGIDAYLIGLTPSLECIWQHPINGGGAQQIYDVATNGARVAVLGVSYGDPTVGVLGTLEGPPGFDLRRFVVMYDFLGAPLWGRLIEGGLIDVAFLDGGDILVAGGFNETFDLDGVSFEASGTSDAFLLRLAGQTGALVEATHFGSPDNESLVYVAPTVGGLLVGAHSEGSGALDLGGGPLGPGNNLGVARWGPSGRHVWTSAFADVFPIQHVKLDTASDQGFFFGGTLSSPMDFGAGPQSGVEDFFIARFDGAGQHVYSHVYGSAEGAQSLAGMASDLDDNVFVGGTLLPGAGGQVDLGGAQPSAVSEGGPFVAKYGPNGELVWARIFDGHATDGTLTASAGPMDVAPDGRVTVAGGALGSIDLGLGVMNAPYTWIATFAP